jgi:hypothetical protein
LKIVGENVPINQAKLEAKKKLMKKKSSSIGLDRDTALVVGIDLSKE